MKDGDKKIKKNSRKRNVSIFHRYKHMEWKYQQLQESKYKFKTPDNLTIITVHNYKEMPYFIRGLNFLNLDHTVLTALDGEWRSAHKIKIVLDFMKKVGKKTEYLLCCDARDVLIMNDPKNIIKIFENNFDCDLLFNSTMHPAWACMPEKFEWFKSVAKKGGRYLNAGVYLGRWDFIIEVLEEAVKYVIPSSLTIKEYIKLGRSKNKKLCKELPNFPKGAADQDIFRYIHQEFYPRMDIDYANEIIYRN